MSLTSRKRRPLEREIEHQSDTNIIWVGIEGSEDVSKEDRYFSIFQKRDLRYQFFIIGNNDGQSSPDRIMNNLKEVIKKYEIRDDDEFWVVIDTDRWTQQTLAQVAKECIDNDFKLAVSNPCFEIWLLYHFEDINSIYNECRDVKIPLSAHLEINPNNHLGYKGIFQDLIGIATERARVGDQNPLDRWPNHTGSRVYRIIDSIKELERNG